MRRFLDRLTKTECVQVDLDHYLQRKFSYLPNLLYFRAINAKIKIKNLKN